MTLFLDISITFRRVMAAVVTLFVVLLWPNNAAGQDTVRVSSPNVIKVAAADTGKVVVRKSKMPKGLRHQQGTSVVAVDGGNGVMFTAEGNDTLPPQPSHSPTKALWMSAVLPGLGQVYNRQAWKIPIIYAAAAGVTYFAITNYQGREKFKNEYINRQNGNTDALLERYANYPDANIYSIYQSYNRNFQLSLIVGGVFYALNIIDAYVYGHLFDFEINEDVSLHLRPNVDFFDYGTGKLSPTTGFTLQLRW